VLAAASLACGVAAAFGWPQGYHAFTAYAAFWTLAVLAGLSAVRFERAHFSAADAAERLVRTITIACALIVVWGLVLGGLGWISTAGYLLVSAATLLIAWLSRPAAQERVVNTDAELPNVPLAFIGVVLVFGAVMALSDFPIRYDSLNYHLYFPAAWLQAGHLTIVPTPFGDEAPAYAPSNAELLYLWLMTPFHGDLLARAAQIPLFALAALALYGIARRAGAPAARAIYPAAFLLGGRRLLENAVGADVDIVFLAMFLAAVLLGFIAAERNRRSDWIVWGLAVGLCCGTKFVALVYAPLWLVICGVRGVRPRALWALPGLIVLAMPWYLRNWIAAGSPIYPSSLTVAGLTLARGAFTHAAMTNSIFHVDDPRLLAVIAADAFGPALFLVWIPAALVGVAVMLVKGPRLARLLAVLPFLLVPLEWFGVPDNTDARFLFPIVALALLPTAFVFPARPRAQRCVHVAFSAALVWLLVGWDRLVTVRLSTLPTFMADRLWLGGLVAPRFLVAATIIGALAVAAARWAARGRRFVRAAASGAALCGLVAVAGLSACAPGGCDALAVTPTYIRTETLSAWEWLRANVHGETIAYAGNNIPYPLFGDRLSNRVYYVNIDRHLDWKLHDYDRARRRGQGELESAPGLLATSSGVLRPTVPGDVSTVDAVRPRFERMHGIRDAWIANLESRGVTVLFVSALSAYEIDQTWHDAGGFPIENAWAEADPASFHSVYRNGQIRIYRVTLPRARA